MVETIARAIAHARDSGVVKEAGFTAFAEKYLKFGRIKSGKSHAGVGKVSCWESNSHLFLPNLQYNTHAFRLSPYGSDRPVLPPLKGTVPRSSSKVQSTPQITKQQSRRCWAFCVGTFFFYGS